MLGSKLALFFVGDRNLLVFSVRTENDIFLCGGQNLPCVVCGSKIVFDVSMEIDLVFVMVEIDLISMWGIELGLKSV